jgi:hypothetical protein
MPRLCLPPAAFGLLLATACAEDPSFVLRWQVGRDATDAEQTLLSVRQCSELGISHVRVTTIDLADRTEVDSREFPCFPTAFNTPEGTVNGPEVGPGEYDVTIVGLTRRGLTRKDDESAEPRGRDKRTISVRESGEGQLADAFRLVGIDECDDGIDNDRDGAIDDGDLACRQGETREGLDNSATLFTFQATLLGGNPNATCNGLGLTSLRVILDGDVAAAQQIPCTTVLQSFSAFLEPGTHTWAVQGVGPGGVAVTREITGDQFEIGALGYGFVPIAVDLGIETFLESFSEALRFSIEYQPYEGAPVNRPCDVTGLDFGDLVLGTTIVTLLDANGGEVMSVTLADATMDEDATFPLAATCTDFDRVRSTSEIPWSATASERAYSMKIETWAAADDPMVAAPCFSNSAAPMQLAPGISPAIAVPRTRTDGACADCDSEDDCSRCEDRVCKL